MKHAYSRSGFGASEPPKKLSPWAFMAQARQKRFELEREASTHPVQVPFVQPETDCEKLRKALEDLRDQDLTPAALYGSLVKSVGRVGTALRNCPEEHKTYRGLKKTAYRRHPPQALPPQALPPLDPLQLHLPLPPPTRSRKVRDFTCEELMQHVRATYPRWLARMPSDVRRQNSVHGHAIATIADRMGVPYDRVASALGKGRCRNEFKHFLSDTVETYNRSLPAWARKPGK